MSDAAINLISGIIIGIPIGVALLCVFMIHLERQEERRMTKVRKRYETKP